MPRFADPPIATDFQTHGTPMPSFPWEQWLQAVTSRFNALQLPRATPKTSASPGATDSITYDANYLYICVGTNSWRRVPLSTF
jgi:hypothetical protein